MSSARRIIILSMAVVLIIIGLSFKWSPTSQAESTTALPNFSEPSISPDGKEIAFVSGSDIWTVPINGGDAHLMVSGPATESRPLYSPDGKWLAFTSTRSGSGDIYILSMENGELTRLTFDDAFEQINSWSRDSKWIYFHSNSRDISGMNDIYRVNIAGGTPMTISDDRYVNEYFCAPAPDGNTLAFNARGIASSQWWRNGHSHIDESEIWLWRDGNYQAITQGKAKDLWPMWNNDGRSLYFVSDRSGSQNLWSQPLKGNAKQLTNFKDGRVLWPSISQDGKQIVFERDFQIWTCDVNNGQAHAIKINRRGAPSGPTLDHRTFSSQLSELSLSPDGKKVFFVAHGEIFAASAKDGGEATRLTRSGASQSQIVWAPDSRKIAYVSNRGEREHIYIYDFNTNSETALTNGVDGDYFPRFSPDGKMIAYQHGDKELHVIELASKQDRVLAQAHLERPPISPDRPFTWSPDSKWIAYMPFSEKLFRNVSVVSVNGGEAKPISFLANHFSNTISWNPDGSFILFDTSQRTELTQIAKIDLLPRTPKFREDQFRDLFKEETPRNTTPNTEKTSTEKPSTPNSPSTNNSVEPTAKTDVKSDNVKNDTSKDKRTEIVFENIRQRLNLLPVGIDVDSQSISSDGKYALMTASVAGQSNIYVFPLDDLSKEPAVARQITSTAGRKSDAQFSSDNKEIYYLENGVIQIVNIDNRNVRSLSVSAEMDIKFDQEKMAIFKQAWSAMNDFFYDANFHGADWNKVRTRYTPQVAGADTPDEVRRLISLMVGELNASHSGISGPGNGGSVVGKLGLRFDRTEYEQQGKLRITEILPLSPVALTQKVQKGDYLLAIDGTEINARTNIDELLSYKINKRVELAIAKSANGEKQIVAVKPINLFTEKGLCYRKWVDDNREYIARVSNGKLGYVHMFDMSSNSLEQLYLDLDTENRGREGVVIDVRNNNGGFVNSFAIDVLSRRGYLTMTPRGLPSGPGRTILGQRSLELPTILITNQHSLSDAEDFSEGYQALKLGKVVGEPTAGWIIYTWGLNLIDGSSLRIPRVKVTDHAGVNMELNPRPVDIRVVRPIGEGLQGHDSQLDMASKELLEEISKKR